MPTLPDATDHLDEIIDQLTRGTPVVLLDFDGTLAPIVDRPGEAAIPDATRRVVERLAARLPVAVISGRDLEDVRGRVALEEIAYSGSHGFEIQLPEDTAASVDKGTAHLELLDEAERQLRDRLGDLEGVEIERKRYGIAVHYRRASRQDADRTERLVDAILDRVGGLAKTHGKKVFDLRPDLDWDKGDAVEWLLDRLPVDDPTAVYLGDDVTDEDAFEVLRDRGVGIVVGERAGESAARYRLEDAHEVRAFLAGLADRFDMLSR